MFMWAVSEAGEMMRQIRHVTSSLFITLILHHFHAPGKL